jgi:hypothetical protein
MPASYAPTPFPLQIRQSSLHQPLCAPPCLSFSAGIAMRARGAWAMTRARGAEAQYLVAGADMLRDGEGASTDGKGE